ncbi:hypothetical protein DV735_g2975, partial [Chaetothyriales sp. CBS 134920]
MRILLIKLTTRLLILSSPTPTPPPTPPPTPADAGQEAVFGQDGDCVEQQDRDVDQRAEAKERERWVLEESFNIQATHDILTYGVPSPWAPQHPRLKFEQLYDHLEFPGAVPRTFIGSLLLSAVATPLVLWRKLSLPEQQVLVRAILGLLNAAALLYYTSRVRRAFGKSTAAWFLFFLASQFHVFYYASRTLPNMFAFAFSTLSLALLLPSPGTGLRQARLALYFLTLATVIFRSELSLLLVAEGLNLVIATAPVRWPLLVGRLFIPAVVSGLVVGLALTVGIDTYFWHPAPFPHFLRHPLWPELAAFLSNVFPEDGVGASAWGTSPWHWYFTSALPRLVLNPVLIPLWFYNLVTPRRNEALNILSPALVYTGLYSLLAHKETRFMFPLIPSITLLAALAASQMSIASGRSRVAGLAKLVIVATTFITALVAHGILLPLSAFTYPGAHSLASLHSLSAIYAPQRQIKVHLTNLALQTGITRFLEMPAPKSPLVILAGSPDGQYPTIGTGSTLWKYDKSDNSTDGGVYNNHSFWDQFDYVIVENPEHALPIGGWDVVDKIAGLGRRPVVLGPSTGRGTLMLGDGSMRREKDGIARLLEDIYGQISPSLAAWATSAYAVVHDVLREGFGGRCPSLTGGYWLHWEPEWKLYVLKRSQR